MSGGLGSQQAREESRLPGSLPFYTQQSSRPLGESIGTLTSGHATAQVSSFGRQYGKVQGLHPRTGSSQIACEGSEGLRQAFWQAPAAWKPNLQLQQSKASRLPTPGVHCQALAVERPATRRASYLHTHCVQNTLVLPVVSTLLACVQCYRTI